MLVIKKVYKYEEGHSRLKGMYRSMKRSKVWKGVLIEGGA
jgi:hypothetical protein